MEGNELNVFAQAHCIENEKDDTFNDTIPHNNKSGFRHFVEESTLRNVSLDGLDELGEVGCSTSDGNIRRTPSSVSSEPPIIRRGFIIETNENYFDSGELYTRIVLVLFLLGSLGTICNSGTQSTDVLDYPMPSFVRLHIFAVVFAVLINLTFIIIGSSSIIDIFPPVLNKIEILTQSILCIVLFSTSMMIFHFGYVNFYLKSEVDPDMNWAHGHSLASGIMGIMSSFNSFLVALIRACKPPHPITMAMTDEIALTSIHSS